MRLTPEQFEVAWRSAVKVHDRAVASKRSIPPADSRELLQQLAMKILNIGDSSHATTERQWMAFLWPAVRFLRMRYFRQRKKVLARLVYEPDMDTVERKGDADEFVNRVVLGEVHDRLSSKPFDEYLDAASAAESGTMSDAERKRKSRAKGRLAKILAHHNFPLPD